MLRYCNFFLFCHLNGTVATAYNAGIIIVVVVVVVIVVGVTVVSYY